MEHKLPKTKSRSHFHFAVKFSAVIECFAGGKYLRIQRKSLRETEGVGIVFMIISKFLALQIKENN